MAGSRGEIHSVTASQGVALVELAAGTKVEAPGCGCRRLRGHDDVRDLPSEALQRVPALVPAPSRRGAQPEDVFTKVPGTPTACPGSASA